MEASKDEHEAFLPPQQDRSGNPANKPGILRRLWPYLRLLAEVVIVLYIFVLSSSLWRAESSNGESTDSLRKSPIPKRKQGPSLKASE